MSDPKITPELIRQHNLTDEEYQLILKQLGREPNITELGIRQFCADKLHADTALPLAANGRGHVDGVRCSCAGPL